MNDTQPTNEFRQTVRDLDECATYSNDEMTAAIRRTGWIVHTGTTHVQQLFDHLASLVLDRDIEQQAHLVLSILAQSLQHFRLQGSNPSDAVENEALIEQVETLYRHLEYPAKARAILLAVLATMGGPKSLAGYVELMTTVPPLDDAGIELAIEPLMKSKTAATMLFPRLLQGIEHASVAPTIIDLANYMKREEFVDEHPATFCVERLQLLLHGLAQRLNALLSHPEAAMTSPEKVNWQVAQSVALGVAICDSLALIGDGSSEKVLREVVALPHRRLRAEGAAALTRLGDEEGKVMLLELLKEPVTRLRVLVYADELGIQSEVDPQYATDEARAESELAMWLQRPGQMGVAPTSLELVDQRRQFWPGFDAQVDCFLFRFEYRMGGGSYANIGIAGPVTFAFAADMADLSPDDIYAAFAGWEVAHEEVYEFDLRDEHVASQHSDVAKMCRRMTDGGWCNVVPIKLGVFFGERILVANAQKEGVDGIALATHEQDVSWYPISSATHPLGPDEVYSIYKGKKLLRTFND